MTSSEKDKDGSERVILKSLLEIGNTTSLKDEIGSEVPKDASTRIDPAFGFKILFFGQIRRLWTETSFFTFFFGFSLGDELLLSGIFIEDFVAFFFLASMPSDALCFNR